MNGEILLLPGMGADARLFASQVAAFPIRVPAWPEAQSGDSLQCLADRRRAVLSEQPAIVGGPFFGGMPALDLAALICPRAAILVGSCTEPSAIAPALRLPPSRLELPVFQIHGDPDRIIPVRRVQRRRVVREGEDASQPVANQERSAFVGHSHGPSAGARIS